MIGTIEPAVAPEAGARVGRAAASPHRYSSRQRLVALLYGIACHLSFAAGIGAMIVSIYFGMRLGRGPFTGLAAVAADLILLAQFAFLHSFLLTRRGATLLARLAPAGLGSVLSTTSFAWIASLQLLLTFAAWSPLGGPYWEPHGAARIAITIAYAAAWLFLLKAMADAGLAVQTGFLGWGAVVRDREPRFSPFRPRGTFRYVRQPIYLAFALTLWTGPVWTVDHLLLAAGWTLYCIVGPALKERRYLRHHGESFARYRMRVPYWLPRLYRFEE